MTTAGQPARIPTVLGIDVEPDGQPDRSDSGWPGFESMLAFVGELRDRLAIVTGERAQFFWALRMDPQIAEVYGTATWIAERYGRELAALRAAGDTLGVHTHAWRRRAGNGPWVADWADAGWTDHCLETSLDAYATAFGTSCEVHRFGDRFISPGLYAALARRGVRVDLTIEPGARSVRTLNADWRSTLPTIDYAVAPRWPYRPLPHDVLSPRGDASAGDPWLLPLTAVDTTALLPHWRRVARAVRYPGRVRHRPVVLWAPGAPAGLWMAIERDLATWPAPYLAFAIRSDVLLAPTFAVPLREKLDALVASSIARRLRFTGPLAALEAAG
jgi:hypothetical protein